MADYNVVLFCKGCKKRLVVASKDKRRLFCNSCQKKSDAYRKEMDKE
ncbi:hypothetical protein HYX10_00165 [Candidatus Woesearchaeota archaeon]|nr:hypothetical protein [Candidatus Woesearchaeota archaeon]